MTPGGPVPGAVLALRVQGQGVRPARGAGHPRHQARHGSAHRPRHARARPRHPPGKDGNDGSQSRRRPLLLVDGGYYRFYI